MRRSPAGAILTVSFLALLGARACAQEGPELLLNGQVEQGKGDQPSVWFAACVPAEGLRMWRDDSQAHAGRFSLTIANEHEYKEQVCNNWAQTLQEVPRGKTLALRAALRAANADAVNVCLQCWDASGQNMLAFTSTAVFRGDQEWLVVKAPAVVVPQGTASIIVRAVLTGKGQAWFDDLSVTVSEDKGQSQEQTSPGAATGREGIDKKLEALAGGRIIANYPLDKDVMVLKYLPDWGYGHVDNIAIANNDGGVRLLAAWNELPEPAKDADTCFMLAFYSRDTRTHRPKSEAATKPEPLEIEAYAIREPWNEATSWNQLPKAAETPSASYDFTAGNGWKVFDITPLVSEQAKDPNAVQGVMLRFTKEDRSGQKNDWSGYAFVSREGAGEWEPRRPMLLVVQKPKEPASQSSGD